jgi:glycosyltransferase involved in cell wall biosynthesis
MLVSVIIPVYDGEKYIVEAVQSVLNQSHKELEVLVIDDGSTDSTVLAVGSITDSRVSLISQENAGAAAARNHGISLATGEFIAFLDHDDVWFEFKLERQLEAIEQDLSVGAVGSLLQYFGAHGPIRAFSGEIADEQQERIAAAKLMPFAPSSMIVRTSVVREVGGFDERLVSEVAPVEDLDFVARIAAAHRIITVPEPLGYYRIHPEAVSFGRFYQMRNGTRFLQDRHLAQVDGHDLTWDEWSTSSKTSWRLKQKDRARFLYRKAGLHFAEGQRSSFLWALLRATILDPHYVVTRILRQRKE